MLQKPRKGFAGFLQDLNRDGIFGMGLVPLLVGVMLSIYGGGATIGKIIVGLQ